MINWEYDKALRKCEVLFYEEIKKFPTKYPLTRVKIVM
nr:MAG TPA: hypothetical protein [Caudoviricetes sp.]